MGTETLQKELQILWPPHFPNGSGETAEVTGSALGYTWKMVQCFANGAKICLVLAQAKI